MPKHAETVTHISRVPPGAAVPGHAEKELPATDFLLERNARLSPDERAAAGKALRVKVPRNAHGLWKRHHGRADPSSFCAGRRGSAFRKLVPIRYGRMLGQPVHLLSGRRRRDGGGSRPYPGDGAPRPDLRRLPFAEFRRLRHARAKHHLRHQ